MKRDPHDPDDEYELHDGFQRENYSLNKFCAEEGMYDPAKEWYDYEPPTITDLAHAALDQREIAGNATYHRPLMHHYKTFLEWLDDAIEEAADQLQYLVAAREAFKEYVRRESSAGEPDASKK